MREEWRECLDGFYEVSSTGLIKRKKPGPGARVGHIIVTNFSETGYEYIVVCMNGQCKNYLVHRLVADAFLGPCPKGKEVNHKKVFEDGTKKNNVENLEYKTRLGNMRHAARLGLLASGERNGSSKLTWKEVFEIRSLYKSKIYTQQELANKFEVSTWVIWCLLNGRTWKTA